jgi:hypothetical protein
MVGTTQMFDVENLKLIEKTRGSRVLMIAASQLEPDILPTLYDLLAEQGKVKKLDVVLYGAGGEVATARRIAILLNKYCDHLSIIAPYLCQSSCTLLALSAQEIIAGDMSTFSPIDPRLNSSEDSSDQAPTSLAAEDIRLFMTMAEKWFGIEPKESSLDVLSAISGSVYPSTLTSLYRSTLEVEMIAKQMLALHFQCDKRDINQSIVNSLMFQYHSHQYGITGEELADLGLNVSFDHDVTKIAWDIVKNLRTFLGGGALKSPEQPRIDICIASKEGFAYRKREAGGWQNTWETERVT